MCVDIYISKSYAKIVSLSKIQIYPMFYLVGDPIVLVAKSGTLLREAAAPSPPFSMPLLAV